MIRIGIVEDNGNTLERLKLRLEMVDGFSICMAAPNGEMALQLLSRMPECDRPQVVLMDIGLPGISGIETTKAVRQSWPETIVLIQTVFEDPDHIFQAIQAGATGYLLKDDPLDRYIEAIHESLNGGATITPSIAMKVMELVRRSPVEQKPGPASQEYRLTRREIEILQYIVDAYSESEIAEKLFLSPHTIRTHVKNIYRKLEVNSRVNAVKLVMDKRLLP